MQFNAEHTESMPKYDRDGVSLREQIEVLRSHLPTIVLLALLGAMSSLIAAWLLPKKFEATVLLSAASNQSNPAGLGAIGSAVSQLGGLASLAGISMSGGSSMKAESIATLQSDALTETYIRDNSLLPELFSRMWDKGAHRWKSADPDRTPTLWKANRFFGEHVRDIRENPKNGLVSLSITWVDPVRAAEWANGLVRMTNVSLRDKAIGEAERSIAYLREEAERTNVVELRNAIYALMESEINKEMLARGSEEYALKVVDPAQPPEEASSPRKLPWAIAGGFAGLLITTIYVLARARFEQR